MPLLSSFRPYRYNPSTVLDAGAVIAPPYDVISPEKRRALLERDPRNVIQLILPEGDESSRYAHADALFREWIAAGTLVREEEPSLYPYAQIFTHPVTGERIERRGLIALLRLSPFSEGKILPHERTLSGPKQDRLKLMLATDANLEAIFGVYRDPEAGSGRRLSEAMASGEPLMAATDSDGVEHTLWRLSDPAMIEGFADDLRDSVVFIVDGHHRYETALDYRRIVRERSPELPDGAPADWIMIFLAPTSDPGLVILPTHRIIHSLPDFDFADLLARLASAFAVTPVGSREEGLSALASHAETPSFLLISGEKMALAVLRDDVSIDDVVDPSLPAPLKRLDVTVLHDQILQRTLGITQEAQAAQSNLLYVKSEDEAFAAAADPKNQLVVVMNPTKLDQVEAVAESGSVMPQKSTYFYPKLASGLLFNPLA
jgi:uncharacterized protein (DUF1015 family)